MAGIAEFSLEGQVVVVTGAGKGIGRGIALDAARSGATVVGCSRTQSDLDSLLAEIEPLGTPSGSLVTDLSTLDGIKDLYDFTQKKFSRIDAVVNNAGVNRLRDAIDYSESEVDALFALNLKTVYWSSVFAARSMIDSGIAGSIVNVTSQAAVAAAPGRAPYSAAKAGVNHLCRSLAAEWAPYGIRVNALAPTVTATPLGIRAMDERPELAAEVKKRAVLRGRAATVEEISRPAIFLLSPAASLITGQTLVVDGGWTL
ncbi:MAG TPA: SDR family oxidoreductase [Amycolatopsis sp.]|uniref:SDR family NAD(P)-dependent oxidoreductase n=1 Tax=Amycolatopsis sp. TaxID=37632 RepID=UPI002B48AF6C|nr:SDR family oxidoreductase [Amycolatopsis sp.]HKS46990.1 SDR family oxidoreductase [Amycolatopsis sp.]